MMDGIRIRMHPTLDILVREDGAVLSMGKSGRHPNWSFGWDNGDGYRCVQHEGKTYKVHRLVCQTFSRPVQGKTEVDHIDRDRSNNFASNLRWADDREQQFNTLKTDNVVKAFGVRACEDKRAWTRAYKQARKEAEARGETWVAPRFRKA